MVWTNKQRICTFYFAITDCNPRATTNKNNVILTLLPLLQYYIILKSVLEQIRSGLGLTQKITLCAFRQ
jgi:hypothetical protein